MKQYYSYLLFLIVMSSFVALPLVEATTTEGEVEFQANGKVINPIDPEGDGGETINPNKPPTAGPLSINYASNIHFGSQTKNKQAQVYFAQEDVIKVKHNQAEKSVPNFVQITDLRGSASGWTLSVRQDGPLKNPGGMPINGAKLTISVREVVSAYGFSEAPTGLKQEVSLTDDGQTTFQLVQAEKGTGVSTWSVFLGKSNEAESGISLKVPENEPQENGIYTTSLTWFLQDTL